MSALVKQTSPTTPTEVIVLFQNLICFVLVAPVALYHGWRDLRTARLGMHVIRAASGTAVWYCLFLAIALMPLTNAVLLTYSAPIFMPLIAWILHRRKAGVAVWSGVAIGFIGIALVLHPHNADLTWGAPIALLGAVALALAMLSVRWLGGTEPSLRILFYYFLISSLLVLPFAVIVWRTPEGWAWVYLAGIGLSLLASQVFIVIAYKYASAVTLAPLIYTAIVFTALINWVVWARVPTWLELAGMVLVILGGIAAMKGGGNLGGVD